MDEIRMKMRTELTNLDNWKEWPACEACFYLAKALNLTQALMLHDLKDVIVIGGAYQTDIPDDQRSHLNTTVVEKALVYHLSGIAGKSESGDAKRIKAAADFVACVMEIGDRIFHISEKDNHLADLYIFKKCYSVADTDTATVL